MKNLVRSLRMERRWTQVALARHLGVSRQTVYALEAGRFDPSLRLAFTIGQVFGRKIEEIFMPESPSN